MRLCKKQGIPFLPFKPLIGQALDLYRRTPHSSPPSPNQTPSPASSASASPSSASPSPESPPSTHGPAVLLPRLHLWREQYGDVFGFTVGATVQLNFALWAAGRSIRNLTLHLIGKRRAAAAVRAEEAAHGEQQGGAAGRGARDLLALMLAAHDEAGNEQMTDQQLMDECITFLLAAICFPHSHYQPSSLHCLPSVRRVASPSHFTNAHLPSAAPSLVASHLPLCPSPLRPPTPGHSTTAHLLTWTFYLLAKHPDWQERLRAELKQALTQQGAGDTSAVPTASTAAGAADKAGSEAGGRWEATREGAAVPFLGRTCQQACRLGPYDVPRGMDVLIPVAMLHYDPQGHWWPGMLTPSFSPHLPFPGVHAGPI
ncbi:unnamed protein product [Closterium sp. Naga37s-1]|nr:unnamed protein product [Closterium sp. Naga37s-1]